MNLIFGVLIAAPGVLQASSLCIDEPGQLVQTHATKDSTAATIVGILNEPSITIGGTDINLVNANKSKSGNCAGQTKEVSSKLGSD